MQLARLLATRSYLDELQELQGKYSPTDFNSYDTRKGMGFNFQLILIDSKKAASYLVESTMEKMETALNSHREEEKEIFANLGLDYSGIEP